MSDASPSSHEPPKTALCLPGGGLTGALYLDKLAEVEAYESIWLELEATALSLDESDDLIGRIIKESDA